MSAPEMPPSPGLIAPARPAPEPASPASVASQPERAGARPPHRTPGLGRVGRQVLAIAFAAAWITCPVIEPVPDGPEQDYPLWLLPVDIAALVSIVAAVVALWRGSRRAGAFGVAAGVLMAVETIICPGIGHHLMGSFLWVQAGLSLFVLLTSAALVVRPLRADARLLTDVTD
jgi:hypothetical protein